MTLLFCVFSCVICELYDYRVLVYEEYTTEDTKMNFI
jgi:hypothetical protein